MNNDKVIDEMLSRIQILEEKVEVLSRQVLGGDSDQGSDQGSDKNKKRCLPGYNSCDIN